MGIVDTDKRWPKWTLLFNFSPEGTRWNTLVFAFFDDEKVARAEYERMAAVDRDLDEARDDRFNARLVAGEIPDRRLEDRWIYCATLRRFHWRDIPRMDAGGLPSPRTKAQEFLDELRAGANGAYWGAKTPQKSVDPFIMRLKAHKTLGDDTHLT
jgi:hypothetical protein